jgi:ABC-type multidrug transport system ATPase subunit
MLLTFLTLSFAVDEVSSGVDALSRRELWAILKKFQEGRVMILTTHLMEEVKNAPFFLL